MIILRVMICLAVLVGSVMYCMSINQPILALACAIGSMIGIGIKMSGGWCGTSRNR